MSHKTHKIGESYCRYEDKNVLGTISQAEKDELDSLTITHQGSCVNLDSVVSVATAMNQGAERRFYINYLNTSAEKKVFSVVL